jgi:tRNA A-37 threonylcarbamoyl transferase component Bud32
VSNDDSQKSNSAPPKPPSTTQPRLPGSAQSAPAPRVIATGAQPRITPTPAQQRFSDTMAAPGLQRQSGVQAAVAKPATNPPLPDEALPEAAPAHQDGYVGTTIADRYRVISKLGEGGMGVVYLAEHVFIEKRVALKVLSEDFARKADLVARFMQEAKAASRIGHENIVDITDFGETASGSVFFAMEFLDGMDLAGHIKTGGAMPFERAKTIMNQICRALGAAHSKGIIHRDMKPENVYLVTREGKPDFVKVLDFGIAKMSALDEGGSRLTRTGMIFGTPEYMSPEQARGDKPDHRVDIYAAGCILYEMLTGDVPFHAETFMGVLTKHMFENPEPPSVRNPNAHVAHEVEQVCLKALAKDRDQRYQTMKEFAVALEACVGGDLSQAWGNEPSGVGGGGLREASQTFRTAGTGARNAVGTAARTSVSPELAPPKKRTGLVIGGLVALLVAGGAAAVVLSQKKPDPPKPVVTAPVETPKPVAEAPKPVEPAKPNHYMMSINTQPPGADVFNGPERLGVTPCNVDLPASDKAVELVMKKHGYKDQPLKIVADKNHDYLSDLTALPHSRPSGGGSKTPKSTAPTVATPAEKPPAAKSEQPKPAGKLRDLKDPFAN